MGVLLDLPSEVLSVLLGFLDTIAYDYLHLTGSSTLRPKIQRSRPGVIIFDTSLPSGLYNSIFPLNSDAHSPCRCEVKFSLADSTIHELYYVGDYHTHSWYIQVLQKPLLNLTTLFLSLPSFNTSISRFLDLICESRVVMSETCPSLLHLYLNSPPFPSSLLSNSVQYFIGTLPSDLITFGMKNGSDYWMLNPMTMMCEWPNSLQHLLLGVTWSSEIDQSEYLRTYYNLSTIGVELGGTRLRLGPKRPFYCPWKNVFPPSLLTLHAQVSIYSHYHVFMMPLYIFGDLPRHLTSFSYFGKTVAPISSSLFPSTLTHLILPMALIHWENDTLVFLRELTYSKVPTIALPSLEKIFGVSGLPENPIALGPLHTLKADEHCEITRNSHWRKWFFTPVCWEALRALTIRKSWTHNGALTVPPNLTSLEITNTNYVEDTLFNALPDSLTDLTLLNVRWVQPNALFKYFEKCSKIAQKSRNLIGLKTLIIRSYLGDLATKVGEEMPADEFLEISLAMMPPTLTRLELEIWRGSTPLALPYNLPWPKQLQHIALPHAHISVSAMAHMKCLNLQTLKLSCFSVSFANEIFVLPQLLAMPHLSHLRLAHIPIWVPTQVYEEILAIDQNSMQNLEEAEFCAFGALSGVDLPSDLEVYEYLKKSQYMAPIHNILRHMKVFTVSPFATIHQRSQINGFQLKSSKPTDSDGDFDIFA